MGCGLDIDTVDKVSGKTYLTDETIRSAVADWFDYCDPNILSHCPSSNDERNRCETLVTRPYGDITDWFTGEVTDMSGLRFAASFSRQG